MFIFGKQTQNKYIMEEYKEKMSEILRLVKMVDEEEKRLSERVKDTSKFLQKRNVLWSAAYMLIYNICKEG